jgi:hypothetical protein
MKERTEVDSSEKAFKESSQAFAWPPIKTLFTKQMPEE